MCVCVLIRTTGSSVLGCSIIGCSIMGMYLCWMCHTYQWGVSAGSWRPDQSLKPKCRSCRPRWQSLLRDMSLLPPYQVPSQVSSIPPKFQHHKAEDTWQLASSQPANNNDNPGSKHKTRGWCWIPTVLYRGNIWKAKIQFWESFSSVYFQYQHLWTETDIHHQCNFYVFKLYTCMQYFTWTSFVNASTCSRFAFIDEFADKWYHKDNKAKQDKMEVTVHNFPFTRQGRVTHICVSKLHHLYSFWLATFSMPSHLNQSRFIVNTLRPRQDGCYFPDNIFKWIFVNGIVWIAIKISLKFVPKGSINNIPPLIRIMAGRRPGDKPLSELMIVILLTNVCVTRPQWVNWSAENKFQWSFILNTTSIMRENWFENVVYMIAAILAQRHCVTTIPRCCCSSH